MGNIANFMMTEVDAYGDVVVCHPSIHPSIRPSIQHPPINWFEFRAEHGISNIGDFIRDAGGSDEAKVQAFGFEFRAEHGITKLVIGSLMPECPMSSRSKRVV